MSGTFSQIYVQVVIAVKGRNNLLQKPLRNDVFKYMAGIVKEQKQKPIIINGVADHVHLFIGIKPNMSVAELVRDVKNNTTKFINSKKWVVGKFEWQEGYGAFSYSHSHIGNVYQYVLKQEEHHRKRTFKEEYMDMLAKFEVPFEERFLFEWLD